MPGVIKEEVGGRSEKEGVGGRESRVVSGVFIQTAHVIKRASGSHPKHPTILPYLPESLQGKNKRLMPSEAFSPPSPGDMLIIDQTERNSPTLLGVLGCCAHLGVIRGPQGRQAQNTHPKVEFWKHCPLRSHEGGTGVQLALGVTWGKPGT